MKITLSLVAVLFLIGCSDNKTEVSKEVKTPKVKTTQEKVAVAVQAVQEDMKVATLSAVEEAKKVVSDVSDVTKDAVEVATKEVKEAVAKIKAPSIDAKVTYKACSACHGADAGNAALGKSKIIKGWTADKIENALNGYKDGTYGGAMKGIMKGQASKLSAKEIKAVSQYISTL